MTRTPELSGLVEVDSSLLRALQEREVQLRRAEEATLVGFWRWDTTHDSVSWSTELYTIFGIEESELVPTLAGVQVRVHPEDRKLCKRFMSEALDRGDGTTTLRILRPDRTVRLLEVRAQVINNESGRPVEIAGTVRDRTEAEVAGRRVHEVTTALELMRSATAAIREADTGEGAVEALLREVCQNQAWTSGCVWDCDPLHPDVLIASGICWGGADLPNVHACELARAAAVERRPVWAAERSAAESAVMDQPIFAVPVIVGGHVTQVIEFAGRSTSPDTTISIAVEGLCTVLCRQIAFAEDGKPTKPDLDGATPALLVSALDEALRNDEFHLMYQPKISLTTNRIVGLEALLRWERPGCGTVGPADFVPAAEASGQVTHRRVGFARSVPPSFGVATRLSNRSSDDRDQRVGPPVRPWSLRPGSLRHDRQRRRSRHDLAGADRDDGDG